MTNVKEWFERVWKDPVGSKVIGSIIFAALSAVGLGIWSVVSDLPFRQVASDLFSFLTQEISVSLILILGLVGFVAITILAYIRRQIRIYIAHRNDTTQSESQPKEKELPVFHYGKDYHFFHERLSSAFPGWTNEIKWYSGKDAVDRLSILMAAPLEFKGIKRSIDGAEFNYREIPLWWFRDTSSMHIEQFHRIGKSKILINNVQEYVVDKIAVYKTSAKQFDFIYVETLSEKPTGAYSHKQEWIEESIARNGYYWEEYAMVGKTAITRQAYDDGAAEIGGKVVQIPHDVKSKVRCLTKYNFIITVNNSPFNSRKFEIGSLEYFNGLLSGATNYQQVFDWMLSFDRREGLTK